MDFEYDVFLSSAAADEVAVTGLAAQLRSAGLRVFDPQETRSESVVASALDRSATMLLCVSLQALDGNWAALEADTYRFRDPRDPRRRLILLRLDDDVRLPGDLETALMVDWRDESPGSLHRLVEACLPATRVNARTPAWPSSVLALTDGHTDMVTVAAAHDGWALSGSHDLTVRLWDLRTGTCRAALGSHAGSVSAIALAADGIHGVSGDVAGEVRVWDFIHARCETLADRNGLAAIGAVVFAKDGRTVVSGDAHGRLRIWDLSSRTCTATIQAHQGSIYAMAATEDGKGVVSVGADGTVGVVDISTGDHRTLEEDAMCLGLAVCAESDHTVLTGGSDGTVRRWDIRNGTGELLFKAGAPVELVTRDLEAGTIIVITRSEDVHVLSMDGDLRATCRLEAKHLMGAPLALDLATDRVLMAKRDGDIGLYSASTGEWRTPLLGDVATHRRAAFAVQGRWAITAVEEEDDDVDDRALKVWDARRSGLQHVVPLKWFLTALAVTPNGETAVGGTEIGHVVSFDLEHGTGPTHLGAHDAEVLAIAFSADGRRAATAGYPSDVIVWDLESREITSQWDLSGMLTAVALDSTGSNLLVGQHDGTLLRIVHEQDSVAEMVGHTDDVTAATFSPDGLRALTGSDDLTVRLWDLSNEECLVVLEGHSRSIASVAFHPSANQAVSADEGGRVRLWNLDAGECEWVLESGESDLQQVAFTPDGETVVAFGAAGQLARWPATPATTEIAAEQITYTNAKVVLVGESQAGKSGLAMRLAQDRWEHTESTLGAWATQLQLPVDDRTDGREIWLWDFGGQADQRLIHQLYLDDAALAVLVFDGQRDDILPRLWDWDRALTATDRDSPKLLVAGRIDRYKVRLSHAQIAEFCEAAGYRDYLETSAKTNVGCDSLRSAIVASIDWGRLPWRTSPRIFQLLKERILLLKDSGRALTTTKELRDWLPTQIGAFEPSELDAVIGLLAGPGAVMPLGFGDYVLLQPELLNAYAQAVIETLREDPQERGCVAEQRVVSGDLNYPSGFQRLPEGDEEIVLRAMYRQLIDRSLCLLDDDPRHRRASLLVFPSYFRRQRPDRPGAPTAFMTYRFRGQLDEIYAGLVVRLHHTDPLDSSDLWRDAADFRTVNGLTLGLRLIRLPDGDGVIELHCDPATETTDQVVFARYVDEHLLARARNLTRLRTYICPNCLTPVENRKAAQQRLEAGKDDVGCTMCDTRIPLLDEIEEHLGDPALLARIKQMREEADTSLHSDSKELLLVAEVLACARQANQLARDKPVSDYGIDAEIEFRNDAGKASGRMVYLQLRSGESHLQRRKDGRRIFRIKDPRHVDYWADQAFPVMLVIRDARGKIEWMEIREPLRRLREENPAGKVRQFVFQGQELDVMAVRRWRDEALRA